MPIEAGLDLLIMANKQQGDFKDNSLSLSTAFERVVSQLVI